MPVYRGRDKNGYFYQWGKNAPGHKKWTKYYYTSNNSNSRSRAKQKAIKQGMASLISRNN